MKKIALVLPDTSYSPEIYALNSYLESNGYPNDIISIHELYHCQHKYSLAYIKMGFVPFWDRRLKIPQVHDYASLSTGKYKKLKNFIKKYLSHKPVFRSFLNESVKSRMNFKDNIPFIYRDMGAENFFFDKVEVKKEYDFCYVGSITDDREVDKVLDNFVNSKYSIALVGDAKLSNLEKYKSHENIIFFGKKDRIGTSNIMKRARIGFNYIPDIDPWNTQTSTKVIEYLAAGLMVISNKYQWIKEFQYQNNIYYYNDINKIDLSDFLNRYEKDIEEIKKNDFSCLKWNNIFDESQILKNLSKFKN